MFIQEFMGSIQKSIGSMGQLQAVSRQHAVTDWYIIKNSHMYIQRLSIFMCVIIVCTSALQAYFVRRLFSSKNVVPSSNHSSSASLKIGAWDVIGKILQYIFIYIYKDGMFVKKWLCECFHYVTTYWCIFEKKRIINVSA